MPKGANVYKRGNVNMIILDVRCTHQLFGGGTSFDFSDIDIGTIGKMDTGDTFWQAGSWF